MLVLALCTPLLLTVMGRLWGGSDNGASEPYIGFWRR
jgi:hypothetical protein